MGSIFVQIGFFTRLLSGDQNMDRLLSLPRIMVKYISL